MHRFVYYETLVRSLKQLGVKNDIAEFDALKVEKGKQTLYGLIETATLILASSTGENSSNSTFLNCSEQIRPRLFRKRDNPGQLKPCRRGGFRAKFLETLFPKMLPSQQLQMTFQQKMKRKAEPKTVEE